MRTSKKIGKNNDNRFTKVQSQFTESNFKYTGHFVSLCCNYQRKCAYNCLRSLKLKIKVETSIEDVNKEGRQNDCVITICL